MNRCLNGALLGAALSFSFFLTTENALAGGDVSLPRLFSDNMVLQEGMSAPVWGWGEDGTEVTVRFRGQTVSTRVAGGKWMVRLRDLKPGGPDTLTIIAGNRIEIKNVLVGEVWLAGGQSNMEFPLRQSFEASNDIASASNPMIRVMRVAHARSESPTNDINASWSEASPESVAGISAVAYYCVRDLQAKMHVPFGLIESDWGGTPAEAWMDDKALRANPDYEIGIIKQGSLDEARFDQSLEKFQKERQAAKESNTTFTQRAPRRPWMPSELYNGMIAPLIPYAIRGALWYQGESNANSPEQAEQYHHLFADLIRNWRSLWSEGEFPFLLVQLAPYKPIQHEPRESAWASLREAQLQAAQKLHNVGMAVITDVGEQNNIHPTHKKPVGDRLALAARALAYHETVEYSGPIYKQMKIKGSHIILTFDHAASGLEARDGDLTGFAIAGGDGKFFWALADIKGNTVVVHSPLAPEPVAVRYGWADYPVVNLWNKAGLPASPFRTDDFAR
ncbi:MAG TPA: sialate O-acetylesterase [Verrucomicrobiae bacterium]